MKKLSVLLGMCVLCSVLVSAGWCYQETATQSTGCGGLSSGTYSCSYKHIDSWSLGYPCYNVYDGNWGTYGRVGDTISYLFINYTKPANALMTSVWQVKDSDATINLTIPSSCWDLNPLQFAIFSIETATGQVDWVCFDSLGKNNIIRSTYYVGNNVYEEAMWWDIPDPQYARGTVKNNNKVGRFVRSWFHRLRWRFKK